MALQSQYVLSLIDVTDNSNYDISSITVNVKNSSNNSPVTNLTASNFRIVDGIGNTSNIPIAFNLTPVSTTSGNYQISFPTPLSNQADLLISLVNTGNTTPTIPGGSTPAPVSNNLAVNFTQKFDANGEAKINYPISKPGTYKFSLDKLNDCDFNLPSDTITFIAAPSNTKSSLSPTINKPYLTQIICSPSKTVPILISLKDDTGKPVANSTFEVTLSSTMQ
ncbi:hypothetical protein [Clostridium botulinum]|uniref:hypothetical protein n=1 Tax=Clostridium botulinum TaxID=1491 RepID=UPI0004DA4CA2|nr:hypothetical protein [Clostridium botulinum]KEI05466.1 hypothetical protein Z952_05330 [Clostridium botulinum C/D str. BKT75002]KEI09417.1 hypothetical protein Z954_12860 [Clostridium botulinum C/D str. BKT2873]MCD3349438.1 hypothetical protein [Clostridium botulinum D/C]MCD3358571.1 hypothetical protein [Clostridium botulinum D/C]MCD3363922.1 hypothetical protein [Clostridium botulinum D/C]